MDSMTLAVVGAAYGTSIAAGVSRRAWLRRSAADALLALLTACAMTAVLTIALQHDRSGLQLMSLLERIEYVAALLAGPTLLFYIRALRGWSFRWTSVLHFLPAFAVVVSASVASLPIEYLLLHQMTYTSVAVALRIRRNSDFREHVLLSWTVLGFMVIVHISQLVRISNHGSAILRNVVPVTMSTVILTVSAWILSTWIARATSSASAEKRKRDVPSAAKTEDHAARLLIRLNELMTGQHLYRRTDLGLHDLAATLNVTSHQLSSALNTVAGVTLLDYLIRFRIEDARRRLLDPAHDGYTIEGLGEMSGFGSRSSFHSAFRRLLGTSPARFRALNRSSEPSPGVR